MSGQPLAVVTGGAGFIGSHMVDLLLEEGFCVHVVDDMTGGHRGNLARDARPQRTELSAVGAQGENLRDDLHRHDAERWREPLLPARGAGGRKHGVEFARVGAGEVAWTASGL